MKNLYFLPLLIFLVSCSQSSQYRASQIGNKEVQSNNFKGTVEDQLVQMIRRAGNGATVSQQGKSYTVRIRGTATSFQGSTSPLFIINGTSMGYNFNEAAEAIAGSEIKSVKILKGQDATFYGSRGAGGVIEIKTKMGN